ncbi:hypothetical protein VAMP_64n128 [Candidatus Vampirococcus lugosii]|uniref:DUF333 domain-containing protein n=2 Tax=Candidatus Vampirococcus lugosii TaxID=2789015 RepID=A0ABS5QLD9_9BACT|nr:hypothetical protein [Candidatus Vampirococcus lugosii]
MKKTMVILFLALLIITGCSSQKNITNKNQDLSPAEQYCLSKGGKIEVHKPDEKENKVCFINDGLDGIRCNVDLFFEKKCGH